MRFTTLLIILSILTFACGDGAPRSSNTPLRAEPTPIPTASIPKDGIYDGRGTVTKINTEQGSVEMDHEDIPGVMPPMRMEFFVRTKAELRPLKVGDAVEFVLEYKHPTETIISIKKAK